MSTHYLDPYGASVAAVLARTDAAREATRRGTTNRNDRGSAAERKARRQWLVDTYGDGLVVECAFPGCTRLLTAETVTVDRYPIPGCQGGTYRRDNIRPACGPCNSAYGGALRSA